MRFACTISAVIVAISLAACRNAAPPTPLLQSTYVWQRNWTEDVTAALTSAARSVDAFAVLAGELAVHDRRIEMTAVPVQWSALVSTGVRVTPVIRAFESLGTLLDEENAPRTAGQIVAIYREIAAQAATSGIAVDELQLDYDCPTAKLGDYARLLGCIRGIDPAIRLSITALPTWLGASSLDDVLRTVDEWVLQVHSFERPTHDDDLTICRNSQVAGYVARAAEYEIPFRLALPTYGYDVAFDETGTFAALVAEGGTREWPETYRVRRVRSDAHAMANLVAEFTKDRPKSMLGIIWFRLPVATDELNWSWNTLAQVMTGNAPTARVEAELRYPQPGLAEVWISGDTLDTNATIHIPSELNKALAYDTFAGFTRTVTPDGRIQLAGGISDDEKLVAWFRMPDGSPSLGGILEVQCER